MTKGKIRIGVGGWTFEPWRGTFYPDGLPQARELEYAGQHLTAMEINGTFYRTQTRATFQKWRDTVPKGFVFSLKAPRYSTNRKALAEAGESIGRFLDSGIAELGEKLGPILWQLAPTKKFDADEMAGFLSLLPDRHDGVKLRHVIEPRHESFDDPAFVAMARDRNIALVYAEHDTYPRLEEQTSDFTYARIQQAREELPFGYPEGELDRLADQALDWAAGGRDVFLYFISGDKVRNPAAAQALISRLGHKGQI